MSSLHSKKVVYIHHGGSIGGAPISMLQMLVTLKQQGLKPLVIFTHFGPILEFAKNLGISTRVVTLRSAFFYGAHVPVRMRMLLSFFIYFWSTVQLTKQIIREEQPDLVHLNTSVLIPVAIAVKRMNVPLVWHVREVPGSNRLLRRWQTGFIMRMADIVIVNSNYVKQFFKKKDRVHVIHNALDLQDYQIDIKKKRDVIRDKFGISSSAPVVLMIGSVQTVKGHFLLVKAAREIVRIHPDVCFVIVAGGVGSEYAQSFRGRVKAVLGLPYDNRELMQRQINRFGLDEHFVFTGYSNDIPEILATSDIVAFLPQAAEGFGRPLIEAMASGRPVVVTDIGPSREIIGEDTGLFVPPGDHSALVQAIVQLLKEPSLRNSMGANGRNRVAKLFSMDKHIAGIIDLYKSILRKE
ncbi:MAG: glycosyltransferase family 4 protein [Candidatus Scalindua sp.]